MVTLALVLSGFGLAATPGVAAAATCSGSSCNGQSPETTGCAASATTLQTVYIRYNGAGAAIGKVELRSSSTCKTRWSRVTSFEGTERVIYEEINRSDGLSYNDVDEYAVQGYSPMVYVGTTYTASACGYLTDPNRAGNCTGYH